MPLARSSSIRQRLSIAALCAAILLPGCRHLETRRVEAVAPDFGVFAVAVNRRPGGAWLWQYSYLPGPRTFDCREDSTFGRVAIRHCPDVAPRGAADLFERTLVAMSRYFPALSDSSLEVVLVRPGTGARLQRSGLVALDRPTLAFALRWDGSRDAARFAARAIVHEATHVVRRGAGAGRSIEEEVLAYMMESCVEHDVYGATSGFVYRDEFESGGETMLPGSAATSARAQGRAYAQVMEFSQDGQVVDSEPFRQFCASLPGPVGSGRR